MRSARSALSTSLVILLFTVSSVPAAATNWLQFNFDAQHSGVNPSEGHITDANVASLHVLWKLNLPGVADGAPVYLSGAATASGTRDLLFVTTKDGHIIALDALTGATVWSHQPASGPNYTTSSPVIDPSGQFVYSYGLDGRVHKYNVGSGHEVVAGGWPELATLKPDVEKCSPPLSTATAGGTTYLYVSNGGYPGDQGDYQGHVTAISLATGAQTVFNADCSDQTVHFIENGAPDCTHVRSAVWGRPGVVYDDTRNVILFATGNGDYDANQGGHDWGDSVLAIHPDGTGAGGGSPIDSFTPTNFQSLADGDIDLGSTTIAILPSPAPGKVPHLGVQSGKDGLLRLLNLDNLSGQGGPGHTAGELAIVPVPQGNEVLTAIAAWRNPGDGGTWIFVANDSGISGLQLEIAPNGAPRLVTRWTDNTGGTSPVVANNILFYANDNGIAALNPLTGGVLWSDGTPSGRHWESPIVVNGRVYVTDESAHLIAYEPQAPPPCVANGTTLCLNNGRFQVTGTWRTDSGGTGNAEALRLTSDTGAFSFFNAGNLEVLIKVLDGCSLNGAYWVFAGGLTNVATTVKVIDAVTGNVKIYRNPLDQAFQPLQDTAAFPTCP